MKIKEKRSCPPATTQHKRYTDKDKKFQDQLLIVYKAFYQKPQTMKEVDIKTGIMRENICRYVATLRQQNRIFPIRERKCKVTNHNATEWTANPALIPENPQLTFPFWL